MESNNLLHQNNYGNYYWGIILKDKNKLVYMYADEVYISNNGDLILKNEKFILGSFAKDVWKIVFAASVIDGNPIAAEHWLEK